MKSWELLFEHRGALTPRGPLIGAASVIALLALAGCACLEADWDVVSIEDYPECSFSNLRQHSRTSAALADKADPGLLEEARKQAEQDCLREKSQSRFDVSNRWLTTLK